MLELRSGMRGKTYRAGRIADSTCTTTQSGMMSLSYHYRGCYSMRERDNVRFWAFATIRWAFHITADVIIL